MDLLLFCYDHAVSVYTINECSGMATNVLSNFSDFLIGTVTYFKPNLDSLVSECVRMEGIK